MQDTTRTRLARILLGDPWRKLLALLLAILLWLYLNSQLIEREPLALRLRQTDPAAPSAIQEDTQTLDLQIPFDSYRVLRYENAATGAQLEGVVLTVSGPQSLVARLLAEPNLHVGPSSAELRALTDAYVFDVDDLRTRAPELLPLIRSMQPRSVRARLARREQQRLKIRAQQIERPATPLPRTNLEEAQFYPGEITLAGPRETLAKAMVTDPRTPLFEFVLDRDGGSSTQEVRGTLRLRAPWQELSILEPEVQVRLPLRPNFKDFEIEVPVLVDAPGREFPDEAARAKLVCEPKVAKLALSACSQLESELQRMSPEQLRQWAQQKARLVAVLPAAAQRDQPQTVIPHFVVYDTAYLEGRDYQVRTPPPVVLTLQK